MGAQSSFKKKSLAVRMRLDLKRIRHIAFPQESASSLVVERDRQINGPKSVKCLVLSLVVTPNFAATLEKKVRWGRDADSQRGAR